MIYLGWPSREVPVPQRPPLDVEYFDLPKLPHLKVVNKIICLAANDKVNNATSELKTTLYLECGEVNGLACGGDPFS